MSAFRLHWEGDTLLVFLRDGTDMYTVTPEGGLLMQGDGWGRRRTRREIELGMPAPDSREMPLLGDRDLARRIAERVAQIFLEQEPAT